MNRSKNFIVYWAFQDPKKAGKAKVKPLYVMHLDYPESVAVAIRSLPWAEVHELDAGSYRFIGRFERGRRVEGAMVTKDAINLLTLNVEGNA